jgi:hypothetical protein
VSCSHYLDMLGWRWDHHKGCQSTSECPAPSLNMMCYHYTITIHLHQLVANFKDGNVTPTGTVSHCKVSCMIALPVSLPLHINLSPK